MHRATMRRRASSAGRVRLASTEVGAVAAVLEGARRVQVASTTQHSSTRRRA